MKFSYIVTAIFLAISSNGYADIKLGQKQYQRQCAACHGKQGEKQALGHSAVIQGVNKTDIITALKARKNGEIEGGGNRAKSRLTDENMQSLAEYIESLGQK